MTGLARWFLLSMLLAASAGGARNPSGAFSADPEPRAAARLDPHRPLADEARLTAADGFTLALAGDLIISRPLTRAPRPPGFDRLIALIRDSDAAFGNMETSLLDIRTFAGAPYPYDGDWATIGTPDVAADLKTMGFDLVGRANNHALDWGLEGMRETTAALDAAAIVHAGAGETIGAARAPRYFESPKARVALVSFATTFRPTSEAMPPRGQAPGRPGLSALHLIRAVHVEAPAMTALAAADCAMNRRNCAAPPAALTLEGVRYVRDTRTFDDYEADPDDLADIGRAIREARQHADLVIVALHAHECARDCEDVSGAQLPAEMLKAVARGAIDAGADVFATTGIHHLGPIEVYHGRPIFYGLANFFWSDIQEPVPDELFRRNAGLLRETYAHPERATDYDLTAPLNAESFADDSVFRSVLARVRFGKGGAEEIRLQPIWLGYGESLRTSGTPRIDDDPVRARATLAAIADATRRYGLPPLNLTFEGGAAVIRPERAR